MVFKVDSILFYFFFLCAITVFPQTLWDLHEGEAFLGNFLAQNVCLKGVGETAFCRLKGDLERVLYMY